MYFLIGRLKIATLTTSRSDTDLQLLSCPLQSPPTKPRSKRTKVSGDKEENLSIQSRVASGRYNTLQEFLSDFEKASSAVIERNQSQVYGEQADETPVTGLVNRIAAFKKLLNSLVRQSQATQSDIKPEPSENDADASAKATSSDADSRNEGVALTLFGNPANPKHLFTSLQKSVKVPFPSPQAKSEQFVEVQAPLREDTLPNGITVTKIAPYNLESQSKPPKRTFGEVFAPRPTLPQLDQPRRARSSSRNALNSWMDPFDAVTNFRAFPGDRTNYCLAALPSGQWLQYGGVTSSPSFWSRRQKQQSSQHSDDGEIAQKHHEDSTFSQEDDPSVLQGVYSSFAPSFDSSGAVVQADSKNLVWWSKRGSRRLNTLISAPQIPDPGSESTVQPGNIGELDESTLDEMVNAFKEENYADNVQDKPEETEESKMSKDLDEMLRDISELLDTLSSYQRIRNLELSSTGSKSAESKETSLDFGDPSTPSTAERGVYETLKTSLAAMIANLPPYAVAKLDGEQLAELNISQKILIENPDYRGTMEKDDFTIQQERAAMAPAGPHHASTPRSAGYNQRIYNPGARLQQAQGSFQTPQAYYGGRQPSMSGPYATGHPSSYVGPRAPATPTQRANYLPGYPQSATQYNQGHAAPQFQRPAQNGYNAFPAQQGPPAAHASPPSYAPRPAAYNAPYGAGQSASPQKAPYGIPQSQPPYVTPNSTNSQQRQPQHRQPLPYGNNPSKETPQPMSPYSNSAAAMTYARSAADQAALMDRSKPRLTAYRNPQSPSIPNPVADNGSPQGRNITLGSKQNGTPGP